MIVQVVVRSSGQQLKWFTYLCYVLVGYLLQAYLNYDRGCDTDFEPRLHSCSSRHHDSRASGTAASREAWWLSWLPTPSVTRTSVGGRSSGVGTSCFGVASSTKYHGCLRRKDRGCRAWRVFNTPVYQLISGKRALRYQCFALSYEKSRHRGELWQR